MLKLSTEISEFNGEILKKNIQNNKNNIIMRHSIKKTHQRKIYKNFLLEKKNNLKLNLNNETNQNKRI